MPMHFASVPFQTIILAWFFILNVGQYYPSHFLENVTLMPAKHLFFFLVDEIMTGTRTGQVLYTLTMLKVFVDQASCVTLGKWCSHGMVLWNAKHTCTDILPQLGYGLGCSQQIYPMAYLYTRQSKAYMPFSIRSNALWQMIGKGCNNLVPPEVDWAGP